MVKKPNKVTKKNTTHSNYVVTLVMADKKYIGQGKTIVDAVEDLGLTWNQIKTKGLMTVICGDRKTEKMFYLKILKRIFANKMTRVFWAKNLQLFLEETASMSG